jgi:hypothetical protein
MHLGSIDRKCALAIYNSGKNWFVALLDSLQGRSTGDLSFEGLLSLSEHSYIVSNLQLYFIICSIKYIYFFKSGLLKLVCYTFDVF